MNYQVNFIENCLSNLTTNKLAALESPSKQKQNKIQDAPIWIKNYVQFYKLD